MKIDVMVWVRRVITWLIAGAILVAIGFSFRPQPIEVDGAVVTRGPLEVTVNEDGRTRIREKYVVSAPLAGQLQRVILKPGDPLVAGQTLLATILPTNPDLLDPRNRTAAEARVKAAEAAVRRADANAEASKAAMESAQSQLDRRMRLRLGDASFDQEVEDANTNYRMRTEEHRSANVAREIASFELEVAQSSLLRSQPNDSTDAPEWHLDLVAPIQGKVLRVFQESAAVVAPGAPLIEIGDPRDIELEIDVLSTDAVRITPGAHMHIEHWGGDDVLEAQVRLIEPGAFTKVSALGVEEQRVNVIGDLVSPVPDNFGDRFRFEARIVTWNSANVLRVPMSALFRHDRDWSVFTTDAEGKALLKTVRIGHHNSDYAEVLDGLAEHDRVVIFPSDRVVHGVWLRYKDAP